MHNHNIWLNNVYSENAYLSCCNNVINYVLLDDSTAASTDRNIWKEIENDRNRSALGNYFLFLFYCPCVRYLNLFYTCRSNMTVFNQNIELVILTPTTECCPSS